MKEETRQIFSQTISSDINRRRSAEATLGELEGQPGFVMSLPETCMSDSDPIIKRASTIYFKNTIIKQWSNREFEEVRRYLMENILDLFLGGDEITRVSYDAILVHMFNTEKLESLNGLFQKAGGFMKTSDMNHMFTALNMYERVFDAEKIKYNLEQVLEVVFSTAGNSILEKMHGILEAKNYGIARIGMVVLAKSYCYYSIPDFLSGVGVFSYVFNLALQVMSLKNMEDEGFLETKKWAAYFMYKSCSKGVKKFYKNNELSEYVRDPYRFQTVYSTFMMMIQERTEYTVEIELYAVDFLVLLTSDPEFFRYMEPDLSYLISGYILPQYSLSGEEEDDFENAADKFLREKYNFFGNDLRGSLNTLFCEIVTRVRQKQEVLHGIANYLISILNAWRENPTHENVRAAYGALFLVASVKTTLIKKMKNVFEHVVSGYVLPSLRGNSLILRSQACYFLSLIDDNLSIGGGQIYEALEDVHNLMKSNHSVLKVEATLAMSFFLSNENVSRRFKPLIPETVESILSLSNVYDIEPLSVLLDSVIEHYPEEISNYAPELVGSISKIVFSHLMGDAAGEPEENRLMVISGFLRSMENLVLSLSHGSPVLKQTYMNTYDVLMYILREAKSDFYQEVLDIFNSYVFMMKEIEGSMWGLFQMVLRLPSDELTVYSSEVADLIDNFVTYGKTSIIESEMVGDIYSIISKLCLCNEENFFDDDFISGCRIIESMILNIGGELLNKDPARLSFFLSVAISGRRMIDESGPGIIYVVELVMNCFILKPKETIQILQEQDYLHEFFESLFEHKNKLKRVHDKKICTLFLGTVCRLQEGEIPGLDVQKLNRTLVLTITSLPSAIKLRNQMKDNDSVAGSSSADSNEEYDASDDGYMDMLEEDIYFETALDHFEPFGYISSILSSPAPGSYANRMISIMTDQQKESVAAVLNGERVIQKV